MEKRDGRGVATVFATNAELDAGTTGTAFFNCHFHEQANALLADTRKVLP